VGRILDIAKSLASELQLASRHGHWILAVSQAADQIISFAAGEVNALAGPGLFPNGTELGVGQNADSSIIVNGDNVQLNPAFALSPTGGFSFLATPPLFVNATTGNDSNDGQTAATALLTLREVARRTTGRFITAVNPVLTLVGNFTEPLMLECTGLPGNTYRVNGDTPAQVGASGSLTGASQAYSAAANTDCRITDAARAWAASVNARIRFTSGAANGAIAWVLADLGAGVARIGQLVNRTTGNAAPLPGIGDTYVVETLTTQIRGYHVRISGGMKFKAFDLNSHCESNDELAQYIVASGQIASTTDQVPQCQLNGCKFENAVIAATQRQNITQSHVGFIGTHSVCAMSFSHSRWLVNSHSTTQNVALNAGTRADIQVHFVGQGAGLTLFSFSAVQLTIDGNAVAAGLAFYSVGGVVCLEIAPRAEVVPALAGNTLFGSGNTSTQSCRIHNGGAFYWLTTPTITGPGIDCLLGGTATTWAAIAGAPQGAMTNANNSASAGALL